MLFRSKTKSRQPIITKKKRSLARSGGLRFEPLENRLVLATVTLFDVDTDARFFVPTNDDLGIGWTGGSEPFNDSAWIAGKQGVGMAPAGDNYENFIQTNVQSQMLGKSPSLYARIPFQVDDPSEIMDLDLDTRFDDGLVFYINGVEIRSQFAPAAPRTWDSVATREFEAGNSPIDFIGNSQRTNAINALQAGENILAVHVMNRDAANDDVLLQMELIATVPDPPTIDIPLFTETDSVTATVPIDDIDGTRWRGGNEPFNDNQWEIETTTGSTNGVGYDYDPLVVEGDASSMAGTNGSVFIRGEFTVADPSLFGTLTLQMRYDDGFVAFLNGVEIARANAAGDPTWNSLASGDHPDGAAVNYIDFDASSNIGDLKVGKNILAIHGLNTSLTSSDALFQAQLIGGQIVQPPRAEPDMESTGVDNAVIIDVLGNDTQGDSPIDPTTVTITAAPSSGNAVVNFDGTITYSPNAGFGGQDGFKYRVSDTTGIQSNAASVTITVASVNAPPVADDDSYSVGPGVTRLLDVLTNDSDSDGSINPASIVIVSPPSDGGSAFANFDGTITYTSPAGGVNSETFTYTVEDNDGATSDPATVTISIETSPPVANQDVAFTPPNSAVEIDVLDNDDPGDAPLDPSSVEIVISPTRGTIDSINPTTGVVTYTPNAGNIFPDTFTYRVKDTLGNVSGLTQVTVIIADIPIAKDDLGQADIDETIVIDVIANDSVPNGFSGSVKLIGSTSEEGGTLTLLSNDRIQYTPSAGFTGEDSFQYELSDDADSSTATVKIVVGSLSLSGYVYVDINLNGTLDDIETTLSNVEIRLTRADDPSFSVVVMTDASGMYAFPGNSGVPLPPGTYTITQTQPIMYSNFPEGVSTDGKQPGDGAVNPDDVVLENNSIGNVVLAAGTAATNWNFREFSIRPEFFFTVFGYGTGFLTSNQPTNLKSQGMMVTFDSGWDGAFQVEASYDPADGNVEMLLYDNDGQVVASSQSGSTSSGGQTSILNYEATAGEPLLLTVTGSNSKAMITVPGSTTQTNNGQFQLDLREMLSRNLTRIGDPQYSALYDLDGNGAINFVDLILARDLLASQLPEGEPVSFDPLPASSPPEAGLTLEMKSTSDDSLVMPITQNISARLIGEGLEKTIAEIAHARVGRNSQLNLRSTRTGGTVSEETTESLTDDLLN